MPPEVRTSKIDLPDVSQPQCLQGNRWKIEAFWMAEKSTLSGGEQAVWVAQFGHYVHLLKLSLTRNESRGRKADARRTLKEIGASASGILLKEQSTPRHGDLNAGIWIGAVRRARLKSHVLRA